MIKCDIHWIKHKKYTQLNIVKNRFLAIRMHFVKNRILFKVVVARKINIKMSYFENSVKCLIQ